MFKKYGARNFQIFLDFTGTEAELRAFEKDALPAGWSLEDSEKSDLGPIKTNYTLKLVNYPVGRTSQKGRGGAMSTTRQPLPVVLAVSEQPRAKVSVNPDGIPQTLKDDGMDALGVLAEGRQMGQKTYGHIRTPG